MIRMGSSEDFFCTILSVNYGVKDRGGIFPAIKDGLLYVPYIACAFALSWQVVRSTYALIRRPARLHFTVSRRIFSWS